MLSYLKQFIKKYRIQLVAVGLLALMFVLALTSMRGDSATMDEIAHIPAGYSYVRYGDYRINPEHPPLLKDAAGLSLLAMDLEFPIEHSSWTQDINGQWNLGPEFLYKSGNDADKMIFWARFPFLLVMLLLGYFIFHWARKLYGNKAGLLALFFYALSPTFIAHSRLVTTDLGIAAFVVIATYFFIKALKRPNWQNILIAGLAFGLAELVKFSTILLVPFFGLLVLAFAWSRREKIFKNFARYLGVLILIFFIGYLLVWIFYIPHVINYPVGLQQRDIASTLSSDWFGLEKVVYLMAGVPILRAFGQYLFGLLMVFQRTMGGNTTYFLGDISNVAWWYYFPMVYLLKVPLALHIFTAISLLWFAWQMKSPFFIKPIKRCFDWVKNHFTEFAMLLFLAIYWIVSIRSNLNIGVRHVLPTFPFVYILVSGQITKLFTYLREKKRLLLAVSYSLFAILLVWYTLANFLVYPHYIAYFNEIIGGSKNGYEYVIDSNVDWGQDLKRLAKFVDENKIARIKVDYFGGGSPEYYLGEKLIPWWSSKGPTTGWIAVSATLYQSSFEDWENSYWWLKNKEPITVIGYSILVYYIE